jgi:hypothetical protein
MLEFSTLRDFRVLNRRVLISLKDHFKNTEVNHKSSHARIRELS